MASVDNCKPTARAPYGARARRGHPAILKYVVTDPRPGSPTATVTIRVRNSAGKTVRTLKLGARTVNKLFATSFTTRKVGTYRFHVYATDAAGNVQAKVGYSTLTVR